MKLNKEIFREYDIRGIWEKDIDDHFVEELLKTNASSLLLGYMRPIVANVTGMTKYPSFNIPFLDMSENEAEISWSE